MADIKRGDIVFYAYGDLAWDAIKLGEILADGLHNKMFCHVAIATDADHEFEADGYHCAVHNISDTQKEQAVIVRLPVSDTQINDALAYMNDFKGQRYDWWLIADKALRDLTDDKLYLPEEFIERKELHMKICSTLVAMYCIKLGFEVGKLDDPEQLFLQLQALLKPEQTEQKEIKSEQTEVESNQMESDQEATE